ncbi:malonyl-CoA/methylmalonyl-CoA synthetase [Cognatiyoonia sediminum]|uniref:Malonyl-CoA/methylmalonyl-CoA synthetase n=1 Tax=Cognatiyoonia sediminum TaxID=1508389 RepID=A0A1M5RTS8_9RHOB|nr:AMP-binding protein [Cognatiyoonia sediminum]SHH29717.1 malonyl-CoA/methylmalonyl-CoA synthetase [Cognatiyoonia sediminum]
MTNTLYDALFGIHEENHNTFLICDDGTEVSFAKFVERAAQIAHVLVDCEVGPGDRVLVQAQKLADTLALYAGTVQAGAAYLPLNTAYTTSEVSYFAEDAAPKLIVGDAEGSGDLASIAEGIGAKFLTLSQSGGSLSSAADTKSRYFETVHRNPDDLAGLLYTSGTTGRSKGAMMSHKNLLSNAQALTDLWQITSDDRLIHSLPIFHTHGLFVAMNTSLLAGAAVRLIESFSVDEILSELPKSTLMMGVPTFYTRLLNDDRFKSDLTQSMRLFISGSAPLLAETHLEFEEKTGHRILERYGMTETNMITSNPYDGERIAGTVGYALPGVEVKVVNAETAVAVGSGEIGVIEVRGDNVFHGYWNMPEKTAEEFRDDGFFITGDLAMLGSDGRVTIVGRAKDLIISGGYNIYPKEIEDVLNNCDGILETAVFGIPHPDFGESVVAAIVTESGATVDESVVEKVVARDLARFKHPRRYVTLEELPRNTMGKVQKNVLRETFS